MPSRDTVSMTDTLRMKLLNGLVFNISWVLIMAAQHCYGLEARGVSPA